MELLAATAYDLAILDVGLPGISGFEMCRRIRAAPQTRDLPIIFLTAKGLLMDMAEGEDAGSDLYLIKPVLATKLLNMVGMFLSADAPLAKRRKSGANH
jgi:two-component system phosphate regulon response regulator PhoB